MTTVKPTSIKALCLGCSKEFTKKTLDEHDGICGRCFNKKTEKEQIMHIMYRKPFASGSVFSDALIETLVSLAFRKPYMIELIRLLFGIMYSEGSGNLKSV